MRRYLLLILLLLTQIPTTEASIAVDTSPSTLINQADSIIIGRITTAEKNYDGYRLIVKVQSYLGEPPEKDVLILSASEGLRFTPETDQSYLFLLDKRNNRLDIAVLGAGMYPLDDAPPEINKLLQAQFTPIEPKDNPLTSYAIITLVTVGLILKKPKNKMVT